MERDKFEKVTDREKTVFNYLAGAFIWNPAFTDKSLAEDLIVVLSKLSIYSPSDREAFDLQRPFIALYILSLMHGSTIVLSDEAKVLLSAGFDNEQQRLEVKARLNILGLRKQITTNFCVFWTSLLAEDHCGPELLSEPERWSNPIEIDPDGKLASLN